MFMLRSARFSAVLLQVVLLFLLCFSSGPACFLGGGDDEDNSSTDGNAAEAVLPLNGDDANAQSADADDSEHPQSARNPGDLPTSAECRAEGFVCRSHCITKQGRDATFYYQGTMGCREGSSCCATTWADIDGGWSVTP